MIHTNNSLFYRSPTCSGVKITPCAHNIHKIASQDEELLFELTTALCCHEKETGIVLIITMFYLGTAFC